MINLVQIIVTAIVTLLLGSCNLLLDNSITGNGNVVIQERKLDNFTNIVVSKGLECIVSQDGNFKVTVKADENLQDGIQTSVENGTLKITSKYNNYENVTKKIYVQLPIIAQLEATSGAELTSEGILKSNAILLKSSSGAELKTNVESEKITLEATSGSDLIVEGKAISLYTSSSSGSSINARNLLANTIFSKSSSGSETEVKPILTLNAKATSGSSIDYYSKPKQITAEENSGGSIEAH